MKYLKKYKIQEAQSSDWKNDITNKISNDTKYYPMTINDIEDVFLFYIEAYGDNLFVERSVCDRQGNIPSKQIETLNREMFPCYKVRFVHKINYKNGDAQSYISSMSNELSVINKIDKSIDEKISGVVVDKKFTTYGRDTTFYFTIIMKKSISDFIQITSTQKNTLPPIDNLRERIINLKIFNIIELKHRNGVITSVVELKDEYSNVKTNPSIILNNTLKKHFPNIKVNTLEDGVFEITYVS